MVVMQIPTLPPCACLHHHDASVYITGVSTILSQPAHLTTPASPKQGIVLTRAADNGSSAQHQQLPLQVSAELDAADLTMVALKAAHASLPSRPAQQLDGGLLKRMLNLAHEAVISAQACVRHHDSGLAESHMGGQQQLQQPNEQPTAQSSQDVQSIIRGSAQRSRVAALTPPAAAAAVLASEPAKADMTFATLLSSSPRAQAAVGRAAALSCVMIQEAMDAQLTVDGTVLIGAAERCCESAFDQWCLCLSYRPAWRVQRAWVLPAMALSAIGESERPAALRVLRWVFNAASAEGSVVAGAAAGEVQLPPLLLTLLAFKCARYGHCDTFRWLYARGRALAAQDITPQVCVADFKAFMEQVMVPSHAAARGDKMLFLMKPEPAATHTYSLMDTAIRYGQEAFVRALGASNVPPPLSSFTLYSAGLAATHGSCRLLQWLHAHPACPFDAADVIESSLHSFSDDTPGADVGDDVIECTALEKLKWLHSVDAFQVFTQRDVNDLVASAGAEFATLPQSAHPVLRPRILWLLDDVGAQWPGGGAASIVRIRKRVNACAVVRMVSELECPWGDWTSEECALVRSRQQQQQCSEGLAGAQRWMQQLHALGCPCACAEAGNA
ncbi:hypothetical protein JKP88DRAFT_265231 [Tribonema minus]|uniref:Uncharacterized protein n=1 Tax=Tribonema minus TaxID=303371 RepID=A0A836CA57_9STRA|nr:hypothetical protein JKP88DRAFT_265231 [Tribonema minus]